jgi:hypothetical protein
MNKSFVIILILLHLSEAKTILAFISHFKTTSLDTRV